ncbi:hypothetical protein N566_04510 [Streptomycetaceae bacterium MP113-05]|nr:hypothetical protein N566_04510 [Streptomycetaceae bacterium MP113-05]
MSIRNGLSEPEPGDGPSDPVAGSLLDAAHDCIAAFGLRRLTLTDVARHAGVSRPTVYRRWRDINTLVADLLTREMRAALLTAAQQSGPADGPGGVRERLVRESSELLRALRGHPLLARILETEPEALVTYTFQRLGSSQRGALELIRPQITAGQADGTIRPGNPDELARMVMLLVQTTAQSWRLVDDVLPLDRLTGELRHLLDSYLRPVEA